MSGEKVVEIVAPRTATAGSLLSQWWTLGDIILDRRTNGSGRHTKVAWVIIDRHMQAKGNSRASIRFIEQATGLSKGIIIKACRELVEWGYMTQRTGIGTRPTEYSPNWSSVSPASNTKSNLSSVLQESNASVPLESNTTDISVLPVSNESYLPKPADKAELQVGRNIDTHGATLAGLTPAAAPRDPEEKKMPFDRFWQSFPRKYQKPKARAAWDKLNPSAGLAERIIEAAGLWAEHYATNPIEKKWMPAPANWLAGERYDEDLPDVYEDPKERAIAKAKDRPAEPAIPEHVEEEETNLFKIFRITKVDEVGSWFLSNYILTVTFEDDDGNDIVHIFKCFEKAAGEEFPSHNSVAMESYSSLNKAVGGWRMVPEENVGKLVQMRAISDGLLEFLGYGDWEPIRRDATVSDIRADTDKGGYVVYLNFNDCDEGDEPRASIKLDCIDDLKRATGRSGRHIKGCRIYMDVYAEDDSIHEFHPHPESQRQAA